MMGLRIDVRIRNHSRIVQNQKDIVTTGSILIFPGLKNKTSEIRNIMNIPVEYKTLPEYGSLWTSHSDICGTKVASKVRAIVF